MEHNYRRTDNPESSSQPQPSNTRSQNCYKDPHNNSYRPNYRPNPNPRNQNPQGEGIIKNEESLGEKSQSEQHYKPKSNKYKKPYKDAVPEENKTEEQSGMIQGMSSPSPSSKPKPSQKKKYCHFYQVSKCKNDCTYLHTDTPLGVCLSLDFCVPCEISIAFCSHDHNPKDCKKQPVGTPALQNLITNIYLALKEQKDQTLTYKRELHDLLDSDSEAKDLVIFKIKQMVKQREMFCDTMNFKIKKALEKQKNMEISPISIKDMICELSMFKRGLPAYSIKRELLFELKQQHSFCIVLGETGSGKTTQVPQFLYQSYLYSPYKVICVQPRKVAAISLAKRVAEELGVKVGEEVGYQVGFGKPSANEGSDKNAYSECEYGNKTKLLFVTESILLKKLTGDCKKGKITRFFADTRAILLDEIHERSLLSDLIFGMMKDQSFLNRYPEMKIFLASATVDVEKFKSYFNGCKALQIPGRTFPIDIKYRPLFEENYIEGTIECMKEIVAQTKKRNTSYQGHIIVFLTSVDEMEDVKDELIKTFGEGFQEKHEILFLHGRLTNEEQQKVFQPSEKTKIILATKVAESSITIDGVKIVIDSGFDKNACYDSQKGITILETELISQASARQRAGRAGRTGPGICYRLYSEETFQKLEIGKKPEIAKVNLDIALLRIKDFGADPVTFKYFEPPEPLTIKSTLKGLVAIGALDETDGTLTVQGKVMMEMSTEPKKTKAIIQACQRGCQDKVIKALAVESFSRSLFFLPSDAKERREFLNRKVGDDSGYQSDYLDYLYIYEKYEEAFKSKSWGWINTNKVNTKTLNKCYTLVGQIQKEIYHLKKKKEEFEQLLSPNKSLISSNVKENILKCFMSSCVMELAKYSGFKKLGYVNIMDGFMFHIHNSSSQKDFFPETNNINSSFALYSQMDNFNGRNLAKSVSIVPSVWMNDTTIISETMGKALLEYIKQNYRYTQREFNMPSWAIRRFRLNFKDRINEWTNRIEKTYQNVVRVIPSGNFSISFVSTKGGDYIDQFFEGLKRELDAEVVKESLIYNLDDTNYTPIIKDGLGVSDLLLPDDFITVSYSKLFGAKTKEEVMSALTLNQNDVCYVTINHQGGYASGDIKFVNKDKARLFVEKNQQKINQKLLELQPALQKIKKKAFVESCQIRVTFTLAESQCIAKVSFDNDHDCEFAMAAIRANPVIDNYSVTVERNKKKPEEFFIKNLNPITDEVILKNRVIGQLSLPKIVVHRKPLNQDAKTISDEDRFIFNSLFTKYLSREEIENMYFTFKAPKNYEHLTRVFISLSSRTVAEKFISEYDGQVGIFGTQRLRIKIENSTTLRANKHVFNVMNWVIQKRKEEILAEGHADLAINIDDLEGKEKEKVQHFNKIKITSKDQALNRRIANEFTRILQGEKFTANSDQDKMKLFTTDMIKVYQSVQDSFVGAGKHLYIAYDVYTKKVTLHSPFPLVIEEAKQMLQNALETKIKFEQIDVSGYDIKKVQNYIQKQNQQDELININLNYLRKVVFIRANKTTIEQFKQQIEKFKRVKASTESDCPLCLDSLNENTVLLYNCGHKFCKECFENYVKYQGERLQVTCPLPDCGKVVAFKDLVENVSLSVKNEVIEQHILLYMRANSQSYKNCPTPDCNYIYPADKLSYDCISCGESYCLKNPQKPHKNHPGETCQEFIDRNDVEKQFELMTKRGEVKITQCCKVPMMKNGGCNHITCHCGKHFCWTCLAVFDTGDETYIHMGRCGG